MKSSLLVFALCAVFLLLSAGGGPQAPARFVPDARDTSSGAAAAQAGIGRKAGAARLPRWHRVIPGMFR